MSTSIHYWAVNKKLNYLQLIQQMQLNQKEQWYVYRLINIRT